MEKYRDPYSVSGNREPIEERNWVLENGGHIHRAFDTPSRYDEQRAQLVPRKAVGNDIVQEHTDRFLEALQIYQSSERNKALKDLDLKKIHSWDDMINEYESAQKKYKDKEKGWRGLPRRIGRFTGDNASSVTPFLKFIPEGGTYTAPLSAGLFLIFGAASRLSEKREQILGALGEVPSTIRNAEYCYEDFATDEIMKVEMTELYIAILLAIMGMMQWLVEKSGWRQIKALLQGPRYEKSLDDMIKDVQLRNASLQRRVDRLTRLAVVTAASTTAKTGLEVGKLNTTADNIKATAEATGVKVDQLSSTAETIWADSKATRTSMQDIQAEISQMNQRNQRDEKGVEAMNNLINVLQEETRKAEWNQKGWQEEAKKRYEAEAQVKLMNEKLQHVQIRDDRPRGMLVTSKELLQILDVDPRQFLDDTTLALRRQGSDRSFQNQGQLLMQTPQFQAWFGSGRSHCLLVDGNGPRASDRISAMTLVSALLAGSLPSETASVITFFCGLHTDPDDSLSGPNALIRGLLAQIIDIYGLTLTFEDSKKYNEFQRFDLHCLSMLLTEVIKKLPRGAVLFCIIDGISLYETEHWVDETYLVLQTISDLTRDPGIRAVFKVLMLSPLASKYVRGRIPLRDHLGLPHSHGEEEGGSLTQRQLQRLQLKGMSQYDDDYFDRDDFDEGFIDGDFDKGNIEDDDV